MMGRVKITRRVQFLKNGGKFVSDNPSDMEKLPDDCPLKNWDDPRPWTNCPSTKLIREDSDGDVYSCEFCGTSFKFFFGETR